MTEAAEVLVDDVVDTSSDDVVVGLMVETLKKIHKNAGSLSHPALVGDGNDHAPAQMQTLLRNIGIEVEATEESVGRYRPLLTLAKDLFRSEFNKAEDARVETKMAEAGLVAPAVTVPPTIVPPEVAEAVAAVVDGDLSRLGEVVAAANAGLTEAYAGVTSIEIAEPPATVTEAGMSKPKKGRGGKKKTEAAATEATETEAAAATTTEAKTKKSDELVPVDVIEVNGANHTFPEKAKRADAVPRPATFFLEPGDIVEKDVHQVDPRRLSGYGPVMPNLDLVRETGNPYPSEPDETVKCADRWKALVFVSFETWKEFVTLGTLASTDDEAITRIAARAGLVVDKKVRSCVVDTLRDLALYGLATQYRSGRSRVFKTKA